MLLPGAATQAVQAAVSMYRTAASLLCCAHNHMCASDSNKHILQLLHARSLVMSYCESGDMGRAIRAAREGGSSSNSSNTTGGSSSAGAGSTSNNANSNSSSSSPQQFGEAAVLRWFVQMCMGVQYLHACQMLHRDLKVCVCTLCNPLLRSIRCTAHCYLLQLRNRRLTSSLHANKSMLE
jgi:serine/threonine protein kinase